MYYRDTYNFRIWSLGGEGNNKEVTKLNFTYNVLLESNTLKQKCQNYNILYISSWIPALYSL